MDIFDWILTLGNQGTLNYWMAQMGWLYVGIKVCMYLLVIGAILVWIWRKKAYCYETEIYVIGPEKTITLKNDFSRIVQHGEAVMLKLKTTKVGGWWIFGGKKILIPMINKNNIFPSSGSFWTKGKIKLYQFGETGYSIVPMKTILAEGKHLSFEPIEPKLSWAESMMRAARKKFSVQNTLSTFAPLAIPLGLGIAVIIAALILSDQLSGTMGSLQAATQALTDAVKNMNACQIGEVAVPPF